MPWTVAEQTFSVEKLNWLCKHLQDRLISRGCDPEAEWASHSPDLNPTDFFLWGYLKDNVYRNNPKIIHELKEAISAKIREIPNKGCVRVCLQHRGAHLEHIMERHHYTESDKP